MTVFAAALGVACALAAMKPGAQAGSGANADPDYAARRYSSLSRINRDDVRELVPLWTFSTGVLRGHEGAPLVVGGVIYVHTPFPNTVYALDLAHEGRILWRRQPVQESSVAGVMCCDVASRGLAYEDGLIFLYQADTTLVALDAATGAERWRVKNADPADGATATSAPFAARGRVLVGVSGGEYGVRGHMTAYDAKTGARLWRAYSTGSDADMLVDPRRTTELGRPVGEGSSLKSWEGEQWRLGGGAPWGRVSYDPELGLVYYGTGNPSTWNPVQRPGDNKWANAIVARDLETGVARWLYQTTPHDQWDYDAVNEMILTEREIDGRPRRLLAHFDRNGFVYTLDRESGELLRAEKFDADANWAKRIDLDRGSPAYGRPELDQAFAPEQGGEETLTRGICPATMGAKNANPAAFSPQTGLFYVPLIRLCMDFEPFRVSYARGQPYTGADASVAPPHPAAMGGLLAWDPERGAPVWQADETFPVVSGALATAGGLVFYGALDGYLKALDARTGQERFRFRTPSGIIGDPIAFSFAGEDYVAVLSGVGGWAGAGLTAGLTGTKEGENSPQVYAALSAYTTLGGQLTLFGLRRAASP